MKCGNSFTEGYARTGVSSKLGLPVVTCPICKTENGTGKKVWSQMSGYEKRQYIYSRIEQTLINSLALAVICFAAIYFIFSPSGDQEALYTFIGSGTGGLLLSTVITFLNSRHIINKLERLYEEGDTDSVTV